VPDTTGWVQGYSFGVGMGWGIDSAQFKILSRYSDPEGDEAGGTTTVSYTGIGGGGWDNDSVRFSVLDSSM